MVGRGSPPTPTRAQSMPSFQPFLQCSFFSLVCLVQAPSSNFVKWYLILSPFCTPWSVWERFELGGGGGGGGAVGGWGVTSYIWHSTDVRAEWPPFSALPGIWLAPFFRQKVYDWLNFWYMKGPSFSDIPVYAQIFLLRDFWGCLFSWWLQYLSNY